jgi:Family of unknown function (DUF5335)
MSVTERIPEDHLADYFTAFTKRFLLDESPEAVDVEVVEPDWGEQTLAEGAHLIGITYEEKTRTLEFELDGADHRIVEPAEVWTLEEPDGFLSAVEVVYPDGGREVVSIKRLGARRH